MTGDATRGVLQLDGVSSGYGRMADTVHEVGLRIEPGTVTTVIGPNGAGKSTLLKTIAGVVPLRAGSILLDGVSVPAEVDDRVVAGITLCSQGRSNFPDLTVEQNLLLAGFTLSRRELRSRLAEARASSTLIAERRTTLMSSFSGGQQQRIEIEMALITRPRVLMLDEPSLGLSPAARIEVFDQVRSIADSGVTVLMVEQNVSAASRVSDRLVVLERGAVVLDGPTAAILDDDELRQVYLGRAAEAEREHLARTEKST